MKLSYTEAEGERSALLAAIRGHSGTCSLRKVRGEGPSMVPGGQTHSPLLPRHLGGGSRSFCSSEWIVNHPSLEWPTQPA